MIDVRKCVAQHQICLPTHPPSFLSLSSLPPIPHAGSVSNSEGGASLAHTHTHNRGSFRSRFGKLPGDNDKGILLRWVRCNYLCRFQSEGGAGLKSTCAKRYLPTDCPYPVSHSASRGPNSFPYFTGKEVGEHVFVGRGIV